MLTSTLVVWVERPWELEIIVRNPLDKPLVAWPEGDNDIRRPDVLNAHQNGIFSMTGKDLLAYILSRLFYTSGVHSLLSSDMHLYVSIAAGAW
jgi:hypothetical protein